MKDSERSFILEAARYLESPTLLVRLTDLVGTPLEKSVALLPQAAQDAITSATRKAMEASLKVAVGSLRWRGPRDDFADLTRRIGAERLVDRAARALQG